MRTRAKYSGCTKTGRPGHRWAGTLIVWAAAAVMSAPASRAEEPGVVLRRYLQSRMQGDLETARRLWDQRDLKRTSVMGIRFADIEASYDDYWMLSADERAARAATHTLSMQDSVVQDEHAYFTVALESPSAPRDTLRYFLQRSNEAWQVSLPYLHATREWTRREGRFVRLRAKRLVQVSTAGLNALDAEIMRALEQLQAPQSAALRLERIKLEYYLCETDDDVRALVGSTRRAGYLPAGQRIVTRTQANMNMAARALVHLALRKTPLRFVPLFEEGLAAALGGAERVDGTVYLRRARNVAKQDLQALELPLQSVALQGKNAVPMASLWCSALLSQLDHEEFVALLHSTGGTASQVASLEADDLREILTNATGKGRRETLRAVQAHLDDMQFAMQPGCETWPAEVRGLNATLQWRDINSEWGLMGYVVDDHYIFTVAAHVPGPPPWMRDLVDSLQAVYADNSMEWVPPTQGENPVLVGDPPPIIVLVRAKLEEDVEVYESALFAEHFLERNYKNDLFGLFVTPDDARLFDYSRNKLVAEFSIRDEPESDLVFYDEEAQRICFRFPLHHIPRPLTAYYSAVEMYSGE